MLKLPIAAVLLVVIAAAGFPAPAHAEPAVLEIQRTADASGWVEVGSLERDAAPIVATFADRAPGAAPFRLDVSSLGRGLAMVCRASAGFGVFCEPLYLEPGVVFVLDLAAGLAVRGSFVRAELPLPGVRVAVVPADLGAAVPFTLPLELRDGGLRREVASDDEGRFELPPLAPGAYFLEAILPGGRVYRGEVFTLPDPASFRRQQKLDAAAVAVWDLGEVEVGDGFDLEVRVSDPAGRPIAGARVAASQGTSAADLVGFDATTNAEGSAELSGFSLERAATLHCRAPGYRARRLDFEQVPALVACELEPLAAIVGIVLDPDDQPLAAATIGVRPAGGAGSGTAARAGVDGRFELAGLPAGRYALTAAAPGFAAAETTVELAEGERLELEPLQLGLGGEVRLRVVDGASGATVEGVLLTIEEPAGGGGGISDAAGELTLITAASSRLVVRTWSEDFVSEKHVFEPAALAAGEPLVVALRRGGWLRAVVWDVAADVPCQGCRLVVHPGGEVLSTDAWGEAYGGPLAPGVIEVERPEVRHLGSTVVEQPLAETRSVRIRAGELSQIRFELGGAPLRVRLAPAPPTGSLLEARAATRSERRAPEADGSFRFARRAGDALGFYLFWRDTEAGLAEVRVGELAAADRRGEVELALRSTAVEGRLVHAGAPLAGLAVRLVGLADSLVWAEVRTGADGRFRILHVPPGGYSLTAGQRTLRFLTVPGFQALDLGSFELEPGGF